MTCAKVTVICRILHRGEVIATGTNACSNPQTVCPRAPGEGYEKCSSVCGQKGHAEIQALAALKAPIPRGAFAQVTGHTYVCQGCQEALYAAGFSGVHACLAKGQA